MEDGNKLMQSKSTILNLMRLKHMKSVCLLGATGEVECVGNYRQHVNIVLHIVKMLLQVMECLFVSDLKYEKPKNKKVDSI